MNIFIHKSFHFFSLRYFFHKVFDVHRFYPVIFLNLFFWLIFSYLFQIIFLFICFYIQKVLHWMRINCVSKLCIHISVTQKFLHTDAQKPFIKKAFAHKPFYARLSRTQMLNLQKLQEASYRDAFLTQNWLYINVFGVETFL